MLIGSILSTSYSVCEIHSEDSKITITVGLLFLIENINNLFLHTIISHQPNLTMSSRHIKNLLSHRQVTNMSASY